MQTKGKGLKIKRIKAACFLGVVALSLIIIWGAAVVSLGQNSVEATTTYDEEETDLAYLTGQKMKVLVIEINPHLNTLPGNPKASDVIHGVTNLAETAVDTQVNDLEWSSGGYLDIETTWEYIDEFPRYKNSFERPDGTEGFAFDEENFLAAADDGSGNYSWFNLFYNDWLSNTKIQDHNFDYGWIINKLDLINRRNNGEFDQVWIASIDPTQLFESMMVGRTAYWINGTPYEADCDNFIIDELSLSRGDSRLHAFGHGIENIMGKLYGMDYNAYGKDSISVSTTEEYLGLNLWERFMLNDYANSGTLNGVGTVHHPFTSSGDYDYSNDVFVNSTYLEWKNKSIENMTGEYTLANHLVWDSEPYNDGGDNLSGGRYWMRMWFSLFPREAGYTSDGYLKNWWKYVVSGDYVNGITTNSSLSYNARVGETFDLSYTLNYWSGKAETGSIKELDSNINISDKEVANFVDGKLKILDTGETTVTLYRDGKSIEYDFLVSPDDVDIMVPNTGDIGSENSGGGIACFMFGSALLWMPILIVGGFFNKKHREHRVFDR